MKQSGGDIVRRALEVEGIELAFGIPGTHNIELYDALSTSERVRTILVTDEQGASFMADGAWRASGRMACVNVVPGAGLTHAMSGIAEAFMDNVPMLVLGCGIRRDTDKAYQLHDVDQRAMVGPVCKATYLPERGEDLFGALREACRVARSGAPGPVFVEVPANLYMARHDVTLDGGPPVPEEAPEIPDAALERVVELVDAAERPLLYLGAGSAAAHEDLVRLAEALEAPVTSTFQGKGVVPERHPLFLWPGYGPAAPPFARDLAAECDLTLAIGCRFGEVATASYGAAPPGALVHVDIDPDVPGRNYPAEVAVVADAGAFVRALLDALRGRERSPDEALRAEIRDGHEEVWEDWLDDVGGERVTPAHLIRTLQEVLGPEAVFTADSGNGTFLAMECLRLDGPRRFLAPVDYSCMGYSVPAAIGAKLAVPDRPVVALAGDGAFLMTGLELLTAAEQGVAPIVCVLRDHELAQISQFQATALNRKVASRLPEYDLEALARGCGATYLSLGGDPDVEGVVRHAAERAEATSAPVVVDVAIDYSRKTFFTRGVVKSVLGRLPLKERVRFVGRALVRRVTG